MRLIENAPEFAAQLEAGLRRADRPDLARQVSGLKAEWRCGCGDDFCFSFYTGPPPTGPWGEGHENVPLLLEVSPGTIIVDAVHGEIRFVEALDRPDLAPIVDELRPAARPSERRQN